MQYLEIHCKHGKEENKIELEYNEIREDICNMISNESKRNPIFKSCVARAIYENDYYISNEQAIECACYYIAIGAYTVITDNINNLDSKVLDRIKQSYDIISHGRYNKYFTEEDKKYIKEDLNKIENSNLLN